MGKGETAAAKKTRTRRPLNKYSAGEAIEKILAQIPADQHDAVLTFVKSGRAQFAGLFRPTMAEMLGKAEAEVIAKERHEAKRQMTQMEASSAPAGTDAWAVGQINPR